MGDPTRRTAGANPGDLGHPVRFGANQVGRLRITSVSEAHGIGRADPDNTFQFFRQLVAGSECRWLRLSGHRHRNESVPHRPHDGGDPSNESDDSGYFRKHGGKGTPPGWFYDGQMKLDYYYPPQPPEHVSRAIVDAAELGYTGFFTAETQYDPFLPLAIAGSEKTGLELGTSIAVAFPRSPMVTAMTSWDLARMSEGRFILGLGTQIRAHITRRFSMEWGNPGPRLKDYIMALRAIWDTWQNATPLRYDGEFYKFTLMTPFFNPGPIPNPDIPVYIAGVGPWLSRMAGEVCDGFFVHPFHTAKYLDATVLPNLKAGAEAAGRSLADVERAASVFIMTGETQAEIEEAMEPVRQQISFYASTPSYAPVLEANGWDFGEELNAMSKRGQWAEMPAKVPDEAVLEVGVAAPIDKLAEALMERYEDRIQRLGFYAVGSGGSIDVEQVKSVIAGLGT